MAVHWNLRWLSTCSGRVCPFQQVANLYNLPREEVLENIRTFTNKGVKSLMPGDPKLIKDIEFKPNGEE
jgi:hypothetical protein